MIYFNVPILITLLRLGIIPLFIFIFYVPFAGSKILCTLLFILLAITDWIDGFLARKWKQTTHFGEFLDPVIDKIIVIVVLLLMVEYFHIWWITLPVSIIVIREIIVSALREWMTDIDKRYIVRVSIYGKLKTFLQMLSLSILLYKPYNIVLFIGVVILYLSMLLTIWSMLEYFYKSIKSL